MAGDESFPGLLSELPQPFDELQIAPLSQESIIWPGQLQATEFAESTMRRRKAFRKRAKYMTSEERKALCQYVEAHPGLKMSYIGGGFSSVDQLSTKR